MLNVMVTGASGFVGKSFIAKTSSKYNIKSPSLRIDNVSEVELEDIDVILHLGGVAHRMAITPPEVYFQGNYELTKSLVVKAKSLGIGHFVSVSYTHLTLPTIA